MPSLFFSPLTPSVAGTSQAEEKSARSAIKSFLGVSYPVFLVLALLCHYCCEVRVLLRLSEPEGALPLVHWPSDAFKQQSRVLKHPRHRICDNAIDTRSHDTTTTYHTTVLPHAYMI